MTGLTKILIVDDDETMRNATQRALQPAGYEILCAADGEEAIHMAQRHRPDLILMDVNMPRMDGIEAMRRIKADADLAATFIVLVSGLSVDTNSQAHGLEIGADGYIARPISTRELLARIQAMLRIKAAEDTVRQLNSELEGRVEARTRDLREAQEQLVRQEKLAVLGQMAGSISHELRNPLAVISNAVYYLKIIQPSANEEIKEYLSLIKKETVNAEKIITDLLDFARIQQVERQAVSIPELVERVLYRYPPPASVIVTLDFPPELPNIQVDARQMEQVFGNLTLNACQAMELGGELKISAVVDGDVVKIAIRDSGTGIPPENMPKLFEPLFTTKPRGIGLGLTVCKNLVEANGGQIEVDSEPGFGSTFSVCLPAG